METAYAQTPEGNPVVRGSETIDLADLVSLLLAAEAPDRDLDLLVQTMLGSDRPVLEVDSAKVRTGFWLREQVPAFTEGREALSALAHTRGYRVETHFDGALWHVETRNLKTGSRTVVKHSLRGVAGVVGIAALVAKEEKR